MFLTKTIKYHYKDNIMHNNSVSFSITARVITIATISEEFKKKHIRNKFFHFCKEIFEDKF